MITNCEPPRWSKAVHATSLMSPKWAVTMSSSCMGQSTDDCNLLIARTQQLLHLSIAVAIGDHTRASFLRFILSACPKKISNNKSTTYFAQYNATKPRDKSRRPAAQRSISPSPPSPHKKLHCYCMIAYEHILPKTKPASCSSCHALPNSNANSAMRTNIPF